LKQVFWVHAESVLPRGRLKNLDPPGGAPPYLHPLNASYGTCSQLRIGIRSSSGNAGTKDTAKLK
jgi:hypothetical protein